MIIFLTPFPFFFFQITYAEIGERTRGELLKMRGKAQAYLDSLTKIAAAEVKRGNLKKALLIYRQILEFYLSKKKTNEVCYFLSFPFSPFKRDSKAIFLGELCA